MKTKIILIISLTLAITYPVKADLVFDTGYNIFDDTDPYYDEVWVIKDAHLDVLGGAMWKLELMNYATANIYDGDIELLVTNDSAVVNIHAGTLDMFAAGDDSLVYLYAYDVTFHPVDEYGESWIEGVYYSNNNSFTLGVYYKEQYSHVNVVPEPTTALLLGLGALLLRKRR